jgi:DNA-binding XRE family transcriptional regulator
METTLTDRVKIVMEEEGLTPSTFADTIGVQRPSMSHILSGRNKPSIDFIQKIILTLPHYNPIWLINGTGDMLQLDLFESEDDLREKKEEKIAQKAKDKKKTKPVKHINFVKQALESNILDDEEIIIPTPPQYKNESVPNQISNEKVSVAKRITPINIPEERTLDESYFNTIEKENETRETTNVEMQETETPRLEKNNTITQTQEQPISSISALIGSVPGKKIERIVVFYDDKTFTVYNPE